MGRPFKYGILLIVLFVAILMVFDGWSMPRYKEKTGWSCAACHVNKFGGVELTEVGKSFQNKEIFFRKVRAKTAERFQSGEGYLPIIFGFFHIAAGFLWFGSILFIHLILKPSYAVKGIPKSELILAWTCMIILAITGMYLLQHRFPSWSLLVTTRTGKLLLAKISIFLLMFSIAAFITFFLRFKMKAKISEGLSRIAVGFKGKGYDFSKSPLWKDGLHMGRHRAGEDLTNEISKAPHGEEALEGFPVIGIWEGEDIKSEEENPFKKIFYFLAYLNLVLIVFVLIIISLMRWGV